MVETTRCSALAEILKAGVYGSETTSPVLTLTERRPAALLRLLADVDDAGCGSALRNLIGFEPPRAPNTAAARGKHALLWLAPGQWLLVCDEKRSTISEHQLAAALANTTGTVVDASHAYMIVEIAGDRGRDVLAKGVPIDLDAEVFEAGACAQSCLADMNVLLHARTAQAIDLYVGRSYAASLWAWLTMSAAEFGYRVAAIERHDSD